MIAAGALQYTLLFKKKIKAQTDSGFMTESMMTLFSCRAAKLKTTGKYIVDAKELFQTNQLVFKIRMNNLFTENLIVEYDFNNYRITESDKSLSDNSIKITLEKIND